MTADGAAAALPELKEAAAVAEKFLPPEHTQIEQTSQTLVKCKEAIETRRAR